MKQSSALGFVGFGSLLLGSLMLGYGLYVDSVPAQIFAGMIMLVSTTWLGLAEIHDLLEKRGLKDEKRAGEVSQ